VLLLLATGVMLKFVYIPVPDRAYDSIVVLQTSILFGQFIRNIHHWSANLLIIVLFAHMLRVFFTGAYKSLRKINWLAGLAIFSLVLLSNFTGYLLPWDQLAYWAVTICASILAYFPGIGGWLQEITIGGKELGPETLSNFFALHTTVLPAFLILLLAFHFWRIRKAGGLAAASKEGSNAAVKEERIELIPHLMVREMAMALAVLAVVMIMAALWDAPLAAKANPGLSPNPTKAPWYFAGLQELLLHLSPRLTVMLIGFMVVLLALLPFLPDNIDTPGFWFGSARSGRLTMLAVALAIVLTPLWILGHANKLDFSTWLVPLMGFAMMMSIYWFSRRTYGVTPHEGVQAAFSFMTTAFILLTVTGVWFRGKSMALVWPW
jgi:quinol-cytochrome oxidoreductase complex cytochrome b subunit